MKRSKNSTQRFPLQWAGIISLVVLIADVALAEEIVRKTKLIRGGDYYEDIFYSGDQEIARQKTTGQKISEQNGEIPDGKIKFLDEAEHTYGEEHYKNGKKQGLARTYSEDGRLKMESYYKGGTLLTSKEYYKNGNLRFELDNKDIPLYKTKNGEAGVGKLYFSDGTLRYEWNLTKSKKTGFQKAYNQKGELVYEAYYDAQGKLIPKGEAVQ